MLKIYDYIDLNWLCNVHRFTRGIHVDDLGDYLFYSDGLYIDPRTREIILDKPNNKELIKFYTLVKQDLVELLEKVDE